MLLHTVIWWIPVITLHDNYNSHLRSTKCVPYLGSDWLFKLCTVGVEGTVTLEHGGLEGLSGLPRVYKVSKYTIYR